LKRSIKAIQESITNEPSVTIKSGEFLDYLNDC